MKFLKKIGKNFKKKIQEDIEEEGEAVETYDKRAKQAPTKGSKRKLRFIKKDEKEHKQILKRLVK